MCFRLIDAKKAQHPVSLLCSVLGVSRAGYYAWKHRPASARRHRDDELISQIGEVHAESNGTYGWPRVHAELRHRDVHVSRKRVARLMRVTGLSGVVKRRKGRTTIRVPGVATAPDLVRRDFSPTAPNRLWVADLTEIATWEGKLYLAVVLDCYSRRPTSRHTRHLAQPEPPHQGSAPCSSDNRAEDVEIAELRERVRALCRSRPRRRLRDPSRGPHDARRRRRNRRNPQASSPGARSLESRCGETHGRHPGPLTPLAHHRWNQSLDFIRRALSVRVART
jgi:hypothetical protein